MLLTGGTGARLGGADKAAVEVGGTSLLRRSLASLAGLDAVVVVGDPVPGTVGVREEPAGGGPAAALLAGVDALPAEVHWVVALAVDMPYVTPATLARLVAAARAEPSADGAVLVDAGGRRQPLCAAYRRASLVAAAPPNRDGLPLHRLLAPLALLDVPSRDRESHDIDDPTDLARARLHLGP